MLLPVRDGERFLLEALDSVLGQTLPDFEIVVVDDGSADRTLDVLAQRRHDRVRVVRQDRAGLVAALARAVDAARAPLLARMDADDVSLPERLERQVRFLEANPQVGLVGCDVEVIDENGRVRDTILLPDDDAALRRRLLLRNPFTHGSVVIRREALVAAGGYRPEYGANEDYDLWRRLAREWELAAVPAVLYRYRRHPRASTATDPERVAHRERLRAELWREPALLRALWGERDRAEATALVREAVRRRRPWAALRAASGYLASASS